MSASAGSVTQQIQPLIARLPAPPAPPANAPIVVFPSALRLTREQEIRLMHHAKNRLDELSRDLGRPLFDVPNREPQWNLDLLNQAGRSFMGRQYFAHLMFHGRVEWRAAMEDSIYQDTNLHMPLTRRILTQQIARAIAYITGTDPWWSCYDIGATDLDFSKKLEKWLRHELHTESDLTAEINLLIELIFIQGQQVAKLFHAREVDYYETIADVAIGPDGQPIIARDGDYIFRSDTFVPDPAWIPPAGEAGPGGQPLDPPTAPRPTAPRVLARDGRTPMPPPGADGHLVWQKRAIQRDIVKAAGPRCANLYYLDFLAPLDAPDLETADCCIHLYDRTLIQLAHQYMVAELQDATAEDQLAKIADLLHKLNPVSPAGDGAVGADSPRAEHRDMVNAMGRDIQEPRTKLAEVWLKYDVNEDGIQESIMLLMDRDANVPLFYDHAANITPDGKRPFRCTRINPIAGTWRGQGMVDVFENLQEAIDLMLNRWNFSQSSSARIDFVHPERTVEGKDDPGLKVNWGGQYTPDGNWKKEDIIESVYLSDIKSDKLQQLLEFLLQIATNMSGVANVNDSRAAGLDTGQLATGVRNIAESGHELFGKYLADMTPGIRSIVFGCMDLALAFLDKPRMFRFFEGDIGRLGQITPEEVRNVKLDVKIELTRYRGQQDLTQAQTGAALVREFYALPYPVQVRAVSLYRQQAAALQIRNADEIFSPLDLMAPAQPAAPEGAEELPPANPETLPAPTP